MAIFPLRRRYAESRKWDPVEEITRLNERVNQMFDRFISGESSTAESTWLPPLDVMENETSFIIKLDVPGMESKDVSVRVEDDTLVMEGVRQGEVKKKTDNWVHLERGYGAFMRSYTLPDYVDRNNIKANCKEGVLTVELAKLPGREKTVRQVPVM